MSKITIRLEGFRELERALAEDLPKATAKNVLKRTAINSMEIVRQKMAQLAPFDPLDRDEDGNHLNETMKTEPAKARRQRGSVKFERSTGVQVMTGPAPVGKRARANAGWQEDGTVKMVATSYARPAADSEGRAVVEFVKNELAFQIEKSKAKIANKLARK